MSTFDYAQSNSLLKEDPSNEADKIPPSLSPDTTEEAQPQKTPRWKLELADHNELPAESSGTQIKRRNSRVSSSAADSSADASALAAVSTTKEPSSEDSNSAVVAPTDKKKEKTLPVKKTQPTKHKLTNVAITTTAKPNLAADVAAILQDNERETATPRPMDTDGSDDNEKSSLAKKVRKPRIRRPRRVIPNEKEYIPEDEQPSQSDVVGGRGGRSNHHPGNRPYWIRILESREEYTRSRSDHEKARIANGILKYVQEDLKGRFLNMDGKTKRWYILPNPVVLDKIKQALRDKYIPYWARDLKIENKKHKFVDVTAAEVRGGANTNAQNIGNTPQIAAFNALNALHKFQQGGGGMRNPVVDPSTYPATLAAINASTERAKAVAASALAGTNQPKNKLDFLLGASARRPLGGTSAIPTVDDILKVKFDQMPSFGGNPQLMAAMASLAPQQRPPAAMAPFQSSLAGSYMNSLGLGGGLGLMNEASNRGFGGANNPTAPALSQTALGLASLGIPPSFGGGMPNMKSLDNFLEEKLAMNASLGAAQAAAFGTTPAALASLNRFNAFAGTSFDSVNSIAPAAGIAAALAPTAATPASAGKKTDWNAMYTKALTNSK